MASLYFDLACLVVHADKFLTFETPRDVRAIPLGAMLQSLNREALPGRRSRVLHFYTSAPASSVSIDLPSMPCNVDIGSRNSTRLLGSPGKAI